MPRKPALTFAGALRILEKHESGAVDKLDKALGGGILVAGAAAVVTGGTALIPAAVLAAVWGWVDQKNEAIGLLRGLVGKLSNRLAKTRGVARRDLIIAAHSTIVVAAFFEVMEERLGSRRTRALAITDSERTMIAVAREHITRGYYESLYRSEIPAPSPSCGFQENLPRLAYWVQDTMTQAAQFCSGLVEGQDLDLMFDPQFRDQVMGHLRPQQLPPGRHGVPADRGRAEPPGCGGRDVPDRGRGPGGHPGRPPGVRCTST